VLGIGKKLIGAATSAALIAKGVQAWGQVLKALLVDMPLAAIQDTIEATKRELESLKVSEGISSGRRKQLSDVAAQAQKINEMADSGARRQAAERLIQQATAQYGEGHGLSYNYARGRLEGAEGFDLRVAAKNREKEISDLETKLRTLDRLMAAEQEIIDKATNDFVSRTAKGEGLLGSIPQLRAQAQFLDAIDIFGLGNGEAAKKAAENKNALMDEKIKESEKLRILKQAAPVAEISERQANARAQKALDEREANPNYLVAKQENERLAKAMEKIAEKPVLFVEGAPQAGAR